MLDRLQRLASWMRPAAPFLVLAGMALLLLCLALLFLTDGGERGDKLLLPAIVAMIWCLCGYVFILAFETVPAFPGAELHGLRRLMRLFARAWHWLLAIIFIGVTVAAIMLSARILSEALA